MINRAASRPGHWHGAAAIAGGAFLAFAAIGQALLVWWFGNQVIEHSPAVLAVYHLLNAPTYALVSMALAGFYLAHRGGIGFALRLGYTAFFISVVLLLLVVLGIMLWSGVVASGGSLSSLHTVALPVAIGSIFYGSVLYGMSNYKTRALQWGPLLLILAPLLIVGMSVAGAGTWLLLAPKLLLGAGWTWTGRGV